MSLTVTVEARLLEGLLPKRGKVESSPTNAEDSITKKAIEKWNEVKNSVSTWLKGVTPKSNEEILKEKRIQAEIERQKNEKEKLNNLKEALPEYQSQQIDGYKGYVDQTVNDLNKANILTISGGQAADPSLPKTKEGVPYFLLKKIEKLPKLNVGIEPSVSSDQFMVKDFALGLDKFKNARPLKSPEAVSEKLISQWISMKIIEIKEEKKLKRKEFGLAEIVTEEKIQKLTVKPETVLDDYKAYKDFSKPELKMLAALILYNHGDKCHLVAGLFDDLSKISEMSREANFHLGICSVKMGFHSEAVKRLLPLIKSEDVEYAAEAMETLAKTLPREYEVQFYEAIKNLKSAELIKAAMKDKIKYLEAKGAYKKGHYNAAIEAAEKVSNKSEFFHSAQFIIGTSHYNRERIQQAINIYQTLDKQLTESTDENLKTLVKINLARIAFQTEKYKVALSYYKKVKESSPLGARFD